MRDLLPVLVLGLLIGPVRGAETPNIPALIEQLGGPRFAQRQAAVKALDELGLRALDDLRRAAAEGDPEVRRQCQELVRRIELRAESARLLAPRRVRLKYKDTPLAEAVQDFNKQTGFALSLGGDPKAVGRKLTFDSGDVSTWEALDQFCRAAGLVERSLRPTPPSSERDEVDAELEQLLRLLEAKEQLAAAAAGGNTPLAVVPGKAPALPTCYAGALRLRVRPAPVTPGWGRTPETTEARFRVEVSPAPGLSWLGVTTLRVEKAVDDQGQTATPVPEMVALPTSRAARFRDGLRTSEVGSAEHEVCVRLGPKPARGLKQVQGTVVGRVRTPLEPVLNVSEPLKAEGQRVAGRGYAVTVNKVAVGADGQALLTLTLEVPFPAEGLYLRRRGGDTWPLEEHLKNFQLQDAAGKPLPGLLADTVSAGVNETGRTASGILLLSYTPAAGQDVPARLVFQARRDVVVEAPFTLDDVPLP